MSAHQFTIKTGNIPPDEYRENLHDAITEVLQMAFLASEITLNEAQTFAVHFLSGFLQALAKR